MTDLSDEQRRRIEAKYAALATSTHYDLLGVDRHADKKAVKRAYYTLTADFHSDRYYGKNLGPYRAMLDAIFSRITQAHDVLTSPERAEYDATLAPPTASAPPPASRAEPPAPSKPPPQRLISGVQPTVNAADLDARRQALARRLVGGMKRPISTPPARPAIDPSKKTT